MRVIGFRDGFRGLVHDWTMSLDGNVLSGILTDGGTILGTSRDKPNKMPVGGKIRDMTNATIWMRWFVWVVVELKKTHTVLKRPGLTW